MVEISHHLWLNSSIGRDLSESDARELFLISKREKYQADEHLFEEGDSARSLFLIVRGSVDVVKKAPNGQESVLASLVAGSIVGEMSLLMRSKHSATGIVREPTTVLRVPWSDFENLMQQDAAIAYRIVLSIARVLAGRLKAINAKLVEMAASEEDGDTTEHDENTAKHDQGDNPAIAAALPSAKRMEEFADFKKKLLSNWSF